jgi:hypothetical protein
MSEPKFKVGDEVWFVYFNGQIKKRILDKVYSNTVQIKCSKNVYLILSKSRLFHTKEELIKSVLK